MQKDKVCKHLRIAHCGSLYGCIDCSERGLVIEALWLKQIITEKKVK